MRNIITVVFISIVLTGCLIPLDGQQLSSTNQNFTIYTFKPNQRVQLQCAEWFWYAGHDQDPRWSDNYHVGWTTMATGRTSSNPINPTQKTKIYVAQVTVDPVAHQSTFKNFTGCYGYLEQGNLEIRPQVYNSGWKNWIVFDQTGLDCMKDNDRHGDNSNDPEWSKRANMCKTGGSGFYHIK
ncbi:MAG: hypothetical protein V3V40_05945 [Nitrosomonadaceae bacterium]